MTVRASGSAPDCHRATLTTTPSGRRGRRRPPDRLHAVDDAVLRRTRSLAAALEPVIGQVYFAPECHAAYARLGFSPSAGHAGPVALPDGPAYFTSRGSLLGQVRPGVIAAAFGVFKPELVAAGVQMGWSLTDAPTIFACRRAGAVAQLQRVLGPADEQVARVRARSSRRSRCSAWKVVRCSPGSGRGGTIPPTRGRGCSTSATCCASAVVTRTSRRGRAKHSTVSRSGCSTTSTWGSRPAATCARAAGTTRSSRRAPSDCARAAGSNADAFTDDGRNGREAIERATDRQMAPAIAALGDDLGMVLDTLKPWGAAMRETGGYVGGPVDLWPNRDE